MIMEFLERYDIEGKPDAIFTTHKHHDHSGNNQNFADLWPGVTIIGGNGEGVYACNKELDDNEIL